MTKSRTPDMDVGIISRAKAFPINAQGGLRARRPSCSWEWMSLLDAKDMI